MAVRPRAEFTQLIHHLLCCLRVGICKLAAGEIEGVVRHQPLGIADLSGFRVGFHFCEERIPDHPRINRPALESGAGVRRRQIDRGDVFIAEARFFQRGDQQVVDVGPLVQPHALALQIGYAADRRLLRDHNRFRFWVSGGVGKVDQIGLRRLGKGRRRIAGRGQIDTTDVQPLQHLRPGGEFDPAYGNALFFQALIQRAAVLQQREDIRLLIADVDGFRRFGQRGGREGGEDQQPGGAESVGHCLFSLAVLRKVTNSAYNH